MNTLLLSVLRPGGLSQAGGPSGKSAFALALPSLRSYCLAYSVNIFSLGVAFLSARATLPALAPPSVPFPLLESLSSLSVPIWLRLT